MAYTIRFNDPKYNKVGTVFNYIHERLAKENVFNARLRVTLDTKGRQCFIIKPVRLVKAKPYCGQHFGECVINPFTNKAPKKKVMTLLESEDWIKFNRFINRCLNRFRVDADVWSTPLDTKGKCFIRKGKFGRIRYDYEETFNSYGRAIHVWNNGTYDQFHEFGALTPNAD